MGCGHGPFFFSQIVAVTMVLDAEEMTEGSGGGIRLVAVSGGPRADLES